jgi:hypothetical protein
LNIEWEERTVSKKEVRAATMERWLQSLKSFCDLTATGIGNCCASSPDFRVKNDFVDKSNLPRPQGRFAKTLPKHASQYAYSESTRIQPPRSFASHGLEENAKSFHSQKSNLSPRERPPAAIHIYTFQSFHQGGPSAGGCTEAMTSHATASIGTAMDHDVAHAECFGGSSRRPPLQRPDNVQSGDYDDVGDGGGGAELAVHRAAARGNAEVLRLVIRCRRRRRRHPPSAPSASAIGCVLAGRMAGVRSDSFST